MTPRTPIFRLPCPTERRAELLGDYMAAQLETLDQRRAEQSAAETELARCKTALDKADELDGRALGEAIDRGEPDPGPKHLQVAQAAYADVKRRADGAGWATVHASNAARQALTDTDRDALVAMLNRKVTETAQSAKVSLDEVVEQIGGMKVLCDLADFVEHFPNQRPNVLATFDTQTLPHSHNSLVALIDAMTSGRSVP